MKNIEMKVGVPLLIVIGFGGYTIGGGFGSRGTNKVYEFSYLEKPAAIVKEDIKLGPDRYYAILDNGDIIRTEITSDEGNKISFTGLFGSEYYINGVRQDDK